MFGLRRDLLHIYCVKCFAQPRPPPPPPHTHMKQDKPKIFPAIKQLNQIWNETRTRLLHFKPHRRTWFVTCGRLRNTDRRFLVACQNLRFSYLNDTKDHRINPNTFGSIADSGLCGTGSTWTTVNLLFVSESAWWRMNNKLLYPVVVVILYCVSTMKA